MSKQQFMGELKQLLGDIPTDEREEALAYYEDYFADAGEENEENLLRELESPEKVAHIIKAGLRDTASKDGEFSETGFSGFYAREKEELVPTETVDDRGFGRNRRFDPSDRSNKMLIYILLAIITAPIWMPVIGAIFGVLAGICGVIIGVICALFFGGIGIIIGGIALAVGSFLSFSLSPMGAILLSGVGMLLVGIGILLTYGGVRIVTSAIPSLFNTVSMIFKKVIGRVRRPMEV